MRDCCFVKQITILGALVSVAVACAETNVAPESSTTDDLASALSAAASQPRALAAITLKNGNVLEIYDVEDGALVTETGRAGEPLVADAYDSLIEANRFADLAAELQPGVAVPAALTDLQTRLAPLARTAPPPPSVVETPSIDGTPAERTVAAACVNKCCDYNWIRQTLCTFPTGWSYYWLRYNYLWNSVNHNSIHKYRGRVCAAIGNSQFFLQCGSFFGGDWTVPAGYYMGAWCTSTSHFNLRSRVNSVTTPHLHTYCGAMKW